MAYEATNTDFALNGFGFGWFWRGLSRIQKTQRKRHEQTYLRLAETSPHLMRDVGFNSETDGTWNNGRHRVAGQARRPSDQLLHARGIRF